MTHRSSSPVPAWLALALIATCSLSFSTANASAQNPDYLREMPAAAQVAADFSGGEPMQARARQAAALLRLYEILREMAGQRFSTGAFPNADERPLTASYIAEGNRLRNEGLATFAPGAPSPDSPRAQWALSIERLQRSAALNGELARRYFSPQFQQQHRAALSAQGALAAAGRADIDAGLRDLSGERPSEWERMSPEAQQGALVFGGLMLTLLLAGALREMRRFGINTSSPPTLHTGFGRAHLHWLSGVVTNYRAWDKTHSTRWQEVSANGFVREFWTSHTYRHEEFELVRGSERHQVHTSHTVVEPATGGEFDGYIGHTVTAVWAVRRGRAQGRYILFRMPGAGQDLGVAVASASMSWFLAPRMWTFWPWVALAFVIGSSTDILNGVLSLTSPNLRGGILAALSIAGWWAVYFAVSIVRDRRFEARELPRLRALVDNAPQG